MSKGRFTIIEALSLLGTSPVFPKGVETLPGAYLQRVLPKSSARAAPDVSNHLPVTTARSGGPLAEWWRHLVGMLRTVMASGRPIGINITIFNPNLDTGGLIARAFVDAFDVGLNR